MDRLYTAKDTAAAVGVTYRTLDYWCRIGVTGGRRARGSGSVRRYTTLDVARCHVLAALHKVGASSEVLRRVWDQLPDDPGAWWGVMTVSPDGTAWSPDGKLPPPGPLTGAYWVVNLGVARDALAELAA